MMGSDTKGMGRFVDVVKGGRDAENIGYVSYNSFTGAAYLKLGNLFYRFPLPPFSEAFLE